MESRRLGPYGSRWPLATADRALRPEHPNAVRAQPSPVGYHSAASRELHEARHLRVVTWSRLVCSVSAVLLVSGCGAGDIDRDPYIRKNEAIRKSLPTYSGAVRVKVAHHEARCCGEGDDPGPIVGLGPSRTTGSMPVRAPKSCQLSTSDGSRVGAWFETSDLVQPVLLALPPPRGSREAKPQSPL
jgi:hypothetical protein